MSEEAPKKSQRLPIWVLKPSEEKEARQNLKSYAYDQCKEYVEAMVECSKIHGIKLFPACSAPRDSMRECILSYQKDSNLDHQRDLIVQRKITRLEEQLAKQKGMERGE